MDRGHEYVRAIQLFYRRNHGQYPASIDQLENTNNVRYLRRRYVDPFTGKDDWRLIHAGPGGILIDSKVNRGLPGTPGGTGTPGSGTGASSFGQSTSSQSSGFQSSAGQNSPGQNGFAQSSFSTSSFSSSSAAEVVVPDVPQRGPAMPASGAGQAGMPSSADLAQNPDMPLLPPVNDVPTSTPPAAGGNPSVPPGTNGQNGSGSTGQSNPMQLLNPMLTSPSGTNPQTQSGGAFPSSSGSFGQTPGGQAMGGALAGVASKATGHSIKAVEDQRDYAKWEFYYDPSKDKGIGGNQQSAAAPNSSSSGFGQSSSSGSSGFSSQSAQPFQSTPMQPTQPALPTRPGPPLADPNAPPPPETPSDSGAQPQ